MLILTGFAMILTSKNMKEKYCNDTEECCWRLQQKMTKEFAKCMTQPRQQKYWFIQELQLRQYFCLNTKNYFPEKMCGITSAVFIKLFFLITHSPEKKRQRSVGRCARQSSFTTLIKPYSCDLNAGNQQFHRKLRHWEKSRVVLLIWTKIVAAKIIFH